VRSPDPYGDDVEAKWPAELRCSDCGKLLAELITPPFRIMCPRCRKVNLSE